MRILKDVYEDDPLQTRRLQSRYDRMQEWYAQEIASLKRGDENILTTYMPYQFNLKEQEEFSRRLNLQKLKLKWGWDIPLLLLKLMSNWDYAKAHDNKYLLRESLHGFPIMNYALGEGPFKASKDAAFGGEDFHIVLRGDDNNLIYFTPDTDGLKKGYFVETLL